MARLLLCTTLVSLLQVLSVCPVSAEDMAQPSFGAGLDGVSLARSLNRLRQNAQSLKPRTSSAMIDAPKREADGGTGDEDAAETAAPVAIGVTSSLRRMEIERVLASIGVEAVYFATMQTGNVKLTFSGTITEHGPDSYSYAGGPEDRLRVKFTTGQTIDYQFREFTGDYSQPDATRFLRRDHRVAFRLISSWGSNVAVSLQKSGDRYVNTLEGVLSDGQSTYDIATTTQGQVVADVSGSGAEYQTREQIAGTVSADGLKVAVDESFRYHFVMFDNAVEDVQHRMSNTWDIGGDHYALVDGNIFRTFKNGLANELDSWKAGGILTRNDRQVGGLLMQRADFTIDTILQAGQDQTIIYSDRLR